MLCIEEIFFGVPCGRASARLLRAVVKRHVLRKTFGLRIFWRTRQKKFHEWNVGRADRGATARRVFFVGGVHRGREEWRAVTKTFYIFVELTVTSRTGAEKKIQRVLPTFSPALEFTFRAPAQEYGMSYVRDIDEWVFFLSKKKKIHRDMFTIRRRREATSCEKRRICIAAVCCCTVRTSTSFTCRRESYSTIRRDR